jgi:phosphate transport system substrate-binding protein
VFKRWHPAARLAALLLPAALVLGACQPAATPAAQPTAGALGESLAGEIVIDGSSTVFPISELASDEFSTLHPGVQIPVGESGTGGGFKKFCSGETDISDASRPIKPSEIDACVAGGVEYVEFKIGNDGIAIVTNNDVDFVDCLTVEQLRTIWAPESEGQLTNWNQVDPAFPDRPLTLFGPGTDSGTFDFFNEEVLGTNAAGEVITPRTDYQPSEDDNVLVQGVSGSGGALGYFGLAYYENNKEQLRVLALDKEADGTCVAPTAQAVLDGSYPLARPLYIYVSKSALERPEMRAFVRYYLENAKRMTTEVGYVALPDADYQAILADFDALVP